MRYIHFIVNPISGSGKHHITAEYLKKYFQSGDFKIEVSYTKCKGHAIELAKEALALNANCIVACGGDGTINEVASCMVNTNTELGILPVGSGNGLASHLQIPRDINKALNIIKAGHSSFIDAGRINGKYFFSNTGIGIDAQIIKKYELYNGRTLWAYVKAALSSVSNFKASPAMIHYNGKTTTIKPFLLFISNSNQMGYNMGLTPQASLTDGLLNGVLVPQLTLIRKLLLGYYLVSNRANSFKEAEHFLTSEITIELPENIFTDIQIDGEFHKLKTKHIEISLAPKALKILQKKR